MSDVINFNKVDLNDLSLVGGKVASLGEMIQNLTRKKVPIPGGFCVTALAYQQFLKANAIDEKIHREITTLNINDVASLQRVAKKIQRWILAGKYPENLSNKIIKHYQELRADGVQRVAVRSSATCEDLPDASFAGLHDTILHVTSQQELLDATKKIFASMYNARAIGYRYHHQFDESRVAMAVAVQAMVHSDNAVSGVMFTLDTESGFDRVMLINASYGLGEAIVSGAVTPDEWIVFKDNVNSKNRSVLRRGLGHKTKKIIYKNKGLTSVVTTKKQQQEFCLNEDEVNEIARLGLIIEKHYGQPMDIEWAQDGKTKKFYIVQARAETVESQKTHAVMHQYRFRKTGPVLCEGKSVGNAVGQGVACVMNNLQDMKKFQEGDVLVTDITNPDWEPIMAHASAIVTNRGGRTCHAAIIARELGIPAVVGTTNGTKLIKSGQQVTVSCATGDEGIVYSGLADYEVIEMSLKNLPKIPVKLSMNLGNPDRAFAYQFIPNEGVGLARLEFVISNMIGVHPNACLKYQSLSSRLKQQIAQQIQGYANPKEYYIEKLREGMAMIAAAFFPKQVIFRFSDFKSNEYANLLGGHEFEPDEENPMLGYRGAARYLSNDFHDAFALECEALKRVREDTGLSNAHVMIPFTRTVDEAKAVLALMKKNGVARGKHGLNVYMMCEIPSNVILADEFLEHFDGFSIGSNDLTQLTFGLDRDSELVAHLFDERNTAVKASLSTVIKKCRKAKKYVGICGQGPSDFPDLADWLVKEGIESLSLTPDSIVKTWDYLAKRK